MCLQVDQVIKRAEGAWGPFIAPGGNLPVGVSETWICSGWGMDMSDVEA
jgi:hypothetical protein